MENKAPADWAVFVYETQKKAWKQLVTCKKTPCQHKEMAFIAGATCSAPVNIFNAGLPPSFVWKNAEFKSFLINKLGLTKEVNTQDNDDQKTLRTYFDEGLEVNAHLKWQSHCRAWKCDLKKWWYVREAFSDKRWFSLHVKECFGSSATVRNDIVWLAHHAKQVLSQAEWLCMPMYHTYLACYKVWSEPQDDGKLFAWIRKYASEIGEGSKAYETGKQGLGALDLDLQKLEQYVQFRQAQTLLAQQHWPPREPAEVDAFLARLRHEIKEEEKLQPKG